MIFVTVGNSLQGFDRLMKEIDGLRETGFLEGDVLVQYGHSRYLPRGCACVPSVAREEFSRHVAEASLVITHGGAGSIGHCLRSGKKPVVVPRRKAHGEIVNDHQVELLRELAAQGRVYPAYEVSDLRAAIESARAHGTTQPVPEGESGVKSIVKEYLKDLSMSLKGNLA